MLDEGEVNVVLAVEVDCGSVVDCSGAVFEERKNVSFELSC